MFTEEETLILLRFWFFAQLMNNNIKYNIFCIRTDNAFRYIILRIFNLLYMGTLYNWIPSANAFESTGSQPIGLPEVAIGPPERSRFPPLSRRGAHKRTADEVAGFQQRFYNAYLPIDFVLLNYDARANV